MLGVVAHDFRNVLIVVVKEKFCARETSETVSSSDLATRIRKRLTQSQNISWDLYAIIIHLAH